MVVGDILVESFSEVIFSNASTKYMRAKGLIIGEIIESLRSTLVTLSKLPPNFNKNMFRLVGTLGDILVNPFIVSNYADQESLTYSP